MLCHPGYCFSKVLISYSPTLAQVEKFLKPKPHSTQLYCTKMAAEELHHQEMDTHIEQHHASISMNPLSVTGLQPANTMEVFLSPVTWNFATFP